MQGCRGGEERLPRPRLEYRAGWFRERVCEEEEEGAVKDGEDDD